MGRLYHLLSFGRLPLGGRLPGRLLGGGLPALHQRLLLKVAVIIVIVLALALALACSRQGSSLTALRMGAQKLTTQLCPARLPNAAHC